MDIVDLIKWLGWGVSAIAGLIAIQQWLRRSDLERARDQATKAGEEAERQRQIAEGARQTAEIAREAAEAAQLAAEDAQTRSLGTLWGMARWT